MKCFRCQTAFRPRRLPIVNVLLIFANFAVFILCEFPHLNTAVYHASFYPGRMYIFPVFLVRIPAWIFLGVWFLHQLIEANFGLFKLRRTGAASRSSPHVSGYIFGLLVARLFAHAGQVAPGDRLRSTA